MRAAHILIVLIVLCSALFGTGCAMLPANDPWESSYTPSSGLARETSRSVGNDSSRGNAMPALRARGSLLPLPTRETSLDDPLLDKGSAVYRLRPLDPVVINLRSIPQPQKIEQIIDEAGDSRGKRIRIWDTCQFPLFTLQASGANPRPTNRERLRQRFMHKFKYFVDNYGQIGCVGCGRCVRECPVNVDIRQVLTTLSSR